jgi:3'(2'), 5'-bisphosphate nucleotidase
MSAADDSALLELAARLAWQAAEIILGMRARGVDTESKPNASPVTEADRQSEALITAGLRRGTPGIAVVAEEEISAGYVPPKSDEYWMVDPLDGTRDFVALRDSFSVNIGLVRDRRPVLGVVAVPALAELYGGLIGQGAWKQDGGGRRRIAVRAPPPSGLAVLSSRARDDSSRIRDVLGTRVGSITQMSSAIKFCRLAEGAADFYARFGRTMEWDTAGPEAILTAAGGRLLLGDGSALGYEKPGWANPPFTCWGCLP